MGNKFDQFIRSKVGNREYEFKDEYWQEAEKMLQAQEPKRSTRPISLWLAFMLLGAFLMYLAYPYLTNTTDVTDSPVNQEDTLTEEEVTRTDHTASVPKVTADKQDFASNSTSSELSTDVSTNTNRIKSEITTNNILEEGAPENAVSPRNKENQSLATNLKTTKGSEHKQKNSKKRIGGIDKTTNRSASNASTQRNDKQPKDARRVGVGGRENAQKHSLGLNISRFGLTARDWFNVSLPVLDIEADLEETTIKPKVHRFWYGGLAWSAIAQDHGPFPSGLGAGLNLNYKFQKRWSAHGDLFLFYRRGEFEPVKQSSVVQYDFSVRHTVYQMVPTHALELSLPLYLRYHINKHAIEGGVSLDYLLAFRGNIITHTSRSVPGSPSEDVNVSTRENIALSAKHLDRVDLYLMTGYHWHFAHNMSAGLRIYFNPWSNNQGNPLPVITANNLIQESERDEDMFVEENPVRELGNWRFGLDLRYYLFSNNKNSRQHARRR